jgi:hypothetical protein
MKASTIFKTGAPAALVLALLAGCGDKPTAAAHGVIQTKYPGQVSAGGATSGQILTANARPETDATYAGGTPGIAGGAGGTTSGAETAGTVQESGQGPSSGATQPSSAGRPGSELQPGDTGGATPPSPNREHAPASNAGAQGAAAPGKLEGKQ